MDDFLLRGGGADDGAAVRELAVARVLAVADSACATRCATEARARARAFELCMRSIRSDPALDDVYDRLLPALERVRRHVASV